MHACASQSAIYIALYRAGHVARVRATRYDCTKQFLNALNDPLIVQAELWIEQEGDRWLDKSFGRGGELKTRLIKWEG
jgi:hypothetical protein